MLNNSTHISTTPTHVYFDVTVSNQDSTNGPVKFYYNNSQSTPFLSNPEQYYFSITRFSLDTPSLPVFIPTMDMTAAGNYNPSSISNQPTIYTITLTYQDSTTGNFYSTSPCPVNWIPEIQNRSIIPNNDQSTGTQDLTNQYYYCYTYQWFILLCNNAFNDAFNQLQTLVALDDITLPVSNPPFMTWNINEGIAVLNCDVGSTTSGGGFLTLNSETYTLTTDPNNPSSSNYSQISIFFNSAMYQLFNSFPAIIYGYGSTISVNGYDVAGGNVLIPVNTYGGQTVQNLPINQLDLSQTANLAQVSQEYSTVSIWNPIESILFTSMSIPVLTQQTGNPFIIQNGSSTANNYSGSGNSIISIITDFQSSNGQYRSFITYSPTGEYRLLDLHGNIPLQNIDIQCYFKTKFGQLLNFYLVTGASCSIKFLFRSRNYYLN